MYKARQGESRRSAGTSARVRSFLSMTGLTYSPSIDNLKSTLLEVSSLLPLSSDLSLAYPHRRHSIITIPLRSLSRLFLSG